MSENGLRWLALGFIVLFLAVLLPMTVMAVGVAGFRDSEPGSMAGLASGIVAGLGAAWLLAGCWMVGAAVDRA